MQDPILRTIQQYSSKPSKQGGLYSLNLGQNNGPYLPKDIMTTNKKSVKLLQVDDQVKSVNSLLAQAGTQFLQSNHLMEPPEIYDNSQKQFTNYDERYKSKLSATDNLVAQSFIVDVVVNKLKEECQSYKEQIQQLEEELKAMNDQINNDNITNIKDIQPMLKNFHQNLKDSLGNEKNESYKLVRELEYLNREKLQIQQSILFSHKRIMELEKLVGIQKKVEQQQSQQLLDNQINEEEDGESEGQSDDDSENDS